MTRLPTPGGDPDEWGAILNDFLGVAHDDQGNLKQASLITGAQQTTQKGQANGYAGLDSGGKVPLAQLPTPAGVGDYLGVQTDGSAAVADSSFSNISWTDTTITSGSSLNFDLGDPTHVQILQAGVYSITVTVDWQDINSVTAGARLVQIFTECQFIVTDQRPGFADAVNETIQSVTTTLYLQPGDNIRITLNQTTGSDLNPFTRMLVTRCA